MSGTINKALKTVLITGLLCLCLLYLASSLDTRLFADMLLARPVWIYVPLCALFVVAMLPMGLRFHAIMDKRCSLAWAMRTVLLGSGVNTLLPARLGDVVKAVFLAANCRIPFSVTICGVFWERLADIVVVLLLSTATAWYFAVKLFFLPPLAMLGALLLGLALACRWPGLLLRLMDKLPHSGLSRQLKAILLQVTDRGQWPRFGRLFGYSALVWFSFSLYNTFFLAFFLNTSPDLPLGALVTAASAIGMMIPGVPANIGTFEASVVAALTLAGHDKSEALALAVALHLVQAAPASIYAVYGALRGQWSPHAPLPSALPGSGGQF